MALPAKGVCPAIVNFCLEPFVSSISCESVTADGFSSSNLVADSSHVRSRGLQVEHYIRPPVTISIDFSVPIDVFCILLCPDLLHGAEMKVELTGSSQRSRGRCGVLGEGYTLHRLTQGPLLGSSSSVLVARNKHLHTNIQTQEKASRPVRALIVQVLAGIHCQNGLWTLLLWAT